MLVLFGTTGPRELLAPQRTASGYEKKTSPGPGEMEAEELRSRVSCEVVLWHILAFAFGEISPNWLSEPHRGAWELQAWLNHSSRLFVAALPERQYLAAGLKHFCPSLPRTLHPSPAVSIPTLRTFWARRPRPSAWLVTQVLLKPLPLPRVAATSRG